MILRNVAARHGRRALPIHISRPALRQLSTSATSTTESAPIVPTNSKSPQSAEEATENPSSVISSHRKKQTINLETIMSLGSDSAHTHQGQSWSRSHKINESEELTPKQQWNEFKRIQSHTRKLGSVVERQYTPTDLVSNPPRPSDVTLELLMASQTHMGHNTSLWNPANSRYIYGVREGIHIISLETTAAHLRRAARVVDEVAYRGGLILFVGTRKGQMEIVTKAAEMAGACHVFTKWTPGAITNRDVILQTNSTKVVDEEDKELNEFGLYSATTRPLMPDLVVCLNPKENYTMLYECGLKDIPTIGVIDTDANPTWVTYTIPANDDSLRSVGVIAGVLGRAGQEGQRRRLKDSASKKIPWATSSQVREYMDLRIKEVLKERKESIGKARQNVEGFNEEEKKILQSQYAMSDVDASEEAMIDILGETAAEESISQKSAESVSPSSKTPDLADIEAQLAGLHTKTTEIEAELKSEKN